MFLFHLFITLVIGLCLLYLVNKLINKLDVANKKDEIFITWFIGISLVIFIRCIANMGLHYSISSNVGSKGLDGEKGYRGYRGEDAKCN